MYKDDTILDFGDWKHSFKRGNEYCDKKIISEPFFQTRKSTRRKKQEEKYILRFLQRVRKVALLQQKVAFRNICLKGIGDSEEAVGLGLLCIHPSAQRGLLLNVEVTPQDKF